MNSITIIGVVSKDPEVSKTQNNLKMMKLVVEDTYENKNRSEAIVTEFNATLFGDMATKSEALRKGDQVAIMGRMQQDSYEDRATKEKRRVWRIYPNMVTQLSAALGDKPADLNYVSELF